MFRLLKRKILLVDLVVIYATNVSSEHEIIFVYVFFTTPLNISIEFMKFSWGCVIADLINMSKNKKIKFSRVDDAAAELQQRR